MAVVCWKLTKPQTYSFPLPHNFTLQNMSTTGIYLTECHSYIHQWIKCKQAEMEMAYSRVSENSSRQKSPRGGRGVYGGPWTKSKVTYTSICIAHRLTTSNALRHGSYSVYLRITPCPPLLPSRRASPPFGWYLFHRSTEGRRLSRFACAQRALRDPSTLVRWRQAGSCLVESCPECVHCYNMRRHRRFLPQRQYHIIIVTNYYVLIIICITTSVRTTADNNLGCIRAVQSCGILKRNL